MFWSRPRLSVSGVLDEPCLGRLFTSILVLIDLDGLMTLAGRWSVRFYVGDWVRVNIGGEQHIGFVQSINSDFVVVRVSETYVLCCPFYAAERLQKDEVKSEPEPK